MNNSKLIDLVLYGIISSFFLISEVSKNAGALGAKQMGAGGGGCMLATAPGKQREVAEAINNAGGKSWIFDIYKY